MKNYVYHFTSLYHLPVIFKAGYLKLTESNLKAPKNYADSLPKPDSELYKPVVWLTDSENPVGNGLEGGLLDKGEIRITLRKRDTYAMWLVWSRRNNIKKAWARILANGNNSGSWYISEKIIPLTSGEVVKIENIRTGETIIDTENGVTTGKVDISRPHGMSLLNYGRVLSHFGYKKGGVYKLAIE